MDAMERGPIDSFPAALPMEKESNSFMTGAMYAGVAGLRTHMSALNVIGNNIANVNTDAYKSKRYVFNEALYTSVHSGSDGTTVLGGRNPAQIGYGASVGSIDLDMSTKQYHPTGIPTDSMIDGDGFYIVGDKSHNMITTQEQLQGMNLTRRGDFTFINGYLVDGNGQVVYGFLNSKVAGNPDTDKPEELDEYNRKDFTVPVLTPIRLPKMYETVGADGKTKVNIVWPQWGSPDTQGGAEESFLFTPEAGTEAVMPDGAPEIPNPEQDLNWISLEGMSVEENGRITGTTSDGKSITIGYIGLAQVDNPNGVTHVDGHYYQALGGAGNVHLCSPGGSVQYVAGGDNAAENNGLPEEFAEVGNATRLTVAQSGDTKLVVGGLEMSGTDLAVEISNMICIQRGYQANTRIVTVTDSMLEELVNMKR